MKRGLIDVLACPTCKGRLVLASEEKRDEVIQGKLYCSSCGESYSIEDGIPILLPSKAVDVLKNSPYWIDEGAGERLQQSYEIAPSRFKQYLDAEIWYVVNKVHPSDIVLELGCGYGRVLEKLSAKVMVGIDISRPLLKFGRKLINGMPNCHLFQMSADCLGFSDQCFDKVVCIQNSISMFRVSQQDVIGESIRVTKAGGKILISSYSDKFWEGRLEFFHLQSKRGLLGEIDWDATRDGVIICKDGFKLSTVSPSEFALLTSKFNVKSKIEEVDKSSIFCEISVSQ